MEVLSPVVLSEETKTLCFALHWIRLLQSRRLGSLDSDQRTRGKTGKKKLHFGLGR
jgi:hypothetical protein